MTVQEAAGVINILKTTYPSVYMHMTQAELLQTANIWSQILYDFSYDAVCAGVIMYIRDSGSGFPPAPGQVIDYIDKIENKTLSEEEAWVLVSRACRNSGYHAAEEYEKLPPEVQRAIGSPSTLRDYAMGSLSDAKRDFGFAYRRTLQNIRFERHMPEKIRRLLGNITENNISVKEGDVTKNVCNS